MGIRKCLDYGTLVGCVSLMLAFLTQMQYPMMGVTHKNLVSARAAQKGGNIEACLEILCHFTLFVLSVDGVRGEDAKAETKQLNANL